MRQLFAADAQRFPKFTVDAAGLFLDYSKNRLDATTVGLLLDLARERGNGLGLALVREIVLAHQGDVAYEHADGATHFIVSLPWRAS